MSLPALAAQGGVGQRAQRRIAVRGSSHIGVTGGISGADIKLSSRFALLAADEGFRAQDRSGTAVGAFDIDPFMSFFQYDSSMNCFLSSSRSSGLLAQNSFAEKNVGPSRLVQR